METKQAPDNITLITLAATILGSPNTTEGVSAFWNSFEHFNMRVLQLNLASRSCSCYPIIVWLLYVSVCFDWQVFDMLE